MRADALRLLSPPRPLPSACSPRATPQHCACAPRRTPRPNPRDAAGRRWPQRSERCCDRQTLRPRRPLRCTSPSLPENRRDLRRVPAPLQRRRLPAHGDHVVRIDAWGTAGIRRLSCRIHACVVPARRYAGHSAAPSDRSPHWQPSGLSNARRCLLPRSFVPRKRKPATQGGRFDCRDEAVRLSGRLPRAARRSRPGSAVRSTAPGRRSPARRSSLRRTRPR